MSTDMVARRLYEALGRIVRDAEAVRSFQEAGGQRWDHPIAWASIEMGRKVLDEYALELERRCDTCNQPWPYA